VRTWTKIAKVIGVSHSTLYRWLDEAWISQDATCTDISGAVLDQVFESMKETHPKDGELMITGHPLRQSISPSRTG